MLPLESQQKAILLRKKGCTYQEILREVPVAKSTLSLWLRNVGLSNKQKQRITTKRIEAGRRGAEAQKRKRAIITQQIKGRAINNALKISLDKTHLWIMGTMLYWAEGSKEKNNSRPVRVKFSNSDHRMIGLFVKWLINVCLVPKYNIRYELYVHENCRPRLKSIMNFWMKYLGLKKSDLNHVYFKKHKIKTLRKNTQNDYNGLLSVVVKKSINLNRKIAGWIEGVCLNAAGLCKGSTPLFGRGSPGSNPGPAANP